MATESYPYKGIEVWRILTFRAFNSRSDFVVLTPRVKEQSRQALSLTYVNTIYLSRPLLSVNPADANTRM